MKTQNETGFSLVELLIAFSVLAIVVSMVAPSMRSVIQANRTEKNAEALFTTMVAARSEAVSRNQNVIICKSASGIFCSTSNDWEDGWLTFIDENGDGTKDITEPVTAVFPGLHPDFTLRSGSSFAANLQFKPDGTISEIGTFSLCNTELSQEQGRSVVLNITGRPRGKDGATVCP